MADFPFCGGAYEGRSVDANAQTCVNLYLESSPGGKRDPILLGTPGLTTFASIDSATVRGTRAANSLLYVVCGARVYSVTTAGVATIIGSIGTVSGRVSMTDNGFQLIIVDGAEGYIYTFATGVFAIISDADFPVADVVEFLDGYFIVNKAGTGSYQISALYDGTSWDALDIVTAEADPDTLQFLISNHRQLVAVGDITTEVYYNTGQAFPFSRIDGAFIECGTAARFSVAKLNNNLFWLAKNRRGTGFVIRLDGYQPQRISTPAIEYEIAQYTTISDAFGFCYTQEAHDFYVLTFPSAGATWCFDATTGQWHKRQSFELGRWIADSYVFFNGMHIVGDYRNGTLYQIDLDAYMDGALAIRRERQCPYMYAGMERIFHHSLQLDAQAGVGDDQNSTPQAMLQWSDDGGHTWSDEVWRPMGQVGEYGKRIIWRRLGQSRNRTYRVIITDAVRVAILGASLNVS